MSSTTARASVAFGAAGAAATALFLLLPSGGIAQGLVFSCLNAAAVAALCVQVVRRRLPGRLWRLLAAAQVLYLVTLVGWYLYPVGLDRTLPYPSPLDLVYWLAYVGWAVFLVGVSRRRATTGGGIAWEELAAALGLGVVAWALLLQPALDAPGASLPGRLASVVYPTLLLVVSSLGVRVALASRRLSVTEALIGLWLGLELAGDTWYSLASLDGSFAYGHPWFATWMLSYTAFGALVLRPDAGDLTVAARDERQPNPFGQAVVLGAISLCSVAAIAAQAGDAKRTDALVMAAVAATAMGILLVRLAATARDLVAEQELHDQLGRAYADLAHSATHDALTGVANRAAFDAFLPRALARRRPAGRSAGLIVVDLDSFKVVNDTYGHPAGDRLLQLVAARLTEALRPADFVARLGGDEFALVIDDGDVRTLLVLAGRVVAALGEPADIGATVIVPSVSAGVHAASPDDTSEAAVLRADTALYAAKATGGGVEMFDATRHRHFIERYQIEVDLRAAVVRDELVLHYQPVIDLASRQVVNAEALVRWNHPTRGFLNPGQFIEVAETSGAIVDVGRWVLRQACRDARAWQSLPDRSDVGVAVNLSRRQLQSPTVVDDIREALDSSDLDPSLLTLEVTETALMADTDEMVARLDKIKAIGVDLAMDDFGTGYSSLSHLRALPIDVLKIDKAFVDGIARDDEEWALAAAIIRLATSLGKRTLAEGIERASQLAHLRTLGCELGQGWLFARAMPLDDFTAFLAAHDGGRRPSG